ncbi:MAG: Uncharacterized protein, similar to the N-terminal domain of Lon protease [uncultured Thiotrichaceae bacterium]|uniref:Uncharacterized protein, similar to the N-terminal domain of Lon protease n=1 Tax=uncultured Thiotrichaceae bacterium TaxID=298394 RepID=A0A6S6S343_9GAMM|nr:MAG: Uncharacterized protein, similar to the N-terminal domain of Lon protease [uncultured Thiotrichaceae bacterium]
MVAGGLQKICYLKKGGYDLYMYKELPLFPLQNMLFPDGVLPLRIFEPRYLSMVSDCLKNETPFVVVLIRRGKEVGGVSRLYEVGTSTKIEDFHTLEDGLLGISCRGVSRVHINDYWTQDDGLVKGRVELFEEEMPLTVNDEHLPMIEFYRAVIQDENATTYREGLIEDWNNLQWLSYRIAEILPITPLSKQGLLEMTTEQRVEELRAVMQANNLI